MTNINRESMGRRRSVNDGVGGQ